MTTSIDRVRQAIQDLTDGKMIILVDHENRENEGDLVAAAESITEEQMNFMIVHCSGIICLPLTQQRAQELNLPLMVEESINSSSHKTPFTVSIDALHGTTTGVSASDRTITSKAVANPETKPDQLIKPGHMFPLRACNGGVLERPGHTEGAIDLLKLSNLTPVAVLSEIMNPDGTMTRGDALDAFAKAHDLTILSIDDVVDYRLATENRIADEACATLPLDQYGEFEITAIRENITDEEHLVLSNLHIKPNATPVVRVHSACTTGDVFCSNRCDCHQQFHYAMQQISELGGIMIYLKQEGRGIGLFNKIKAYALQEKGYDTVEANELLGLPVDSRRYHIAANVLRNRNIKQIRLLTNNPNKVEDLIKFGVTFVEPVFMPSFHNEHNQQYLTTKKNKLSHAINFDHILDIQRKSQ